MTQKFLLSFLISFFLIKSWQPQAAGPVQNKTYLPLVARSGVGAALQWAYGGCYASWCETGWYSSPALLDIDGDGNDEIIASAYSLAALEGESGRLIWRAGSTEHRTWPGIVVGDLNRDGQPEIVTAQSGGLVSAYRPNGARIWQAQPAGGVGEFRGLLAADLDGSGGAWEIVVTRAYGSAQNTWVLDASGVTRPGWPQMAAPEDNPDGYAWGVYNANAAAGNLDADGALELVVPSDVHYIHAYQPDGTKIAANGSSFPGKKWGQVGVWESQAPELRGWGECDGARAESFRTNFADGPAAIADLDGDGQNEVVVTGNMYDCSTPSYDSQYTAVHIFNADRSRFNRGGYDWRTIPADTGAPLSVDYEVIETAEPNPVIADLDGDGKQEILFAAYDGRVHAFWLDKTEHGSWPFAVSQAGEGFIRFASEPVVLDLQNDGKAEVLFASWTQIGSGQWGRLHILDWSGKPIFEMDLPAPRGEGISWNGILAAPTLGNVDVDPDLEIVLNSAHSGVIVYDLLGSAGARILWGTGRGNYGRTGSR